MPASPQPDTARPAPAGEGHLAVPTPGGERSVSFALYAPAQAPEAAPLLVLAHGAGAGREHPFMLAAARAFTGVGCAVLLFNFPYMEAGRKMPDREETLLAALEAAWGEALRRRPRARPRVLGGKSLGGRMAARLTAAGRAKPDGLLYLGYPLHPPGEPEKLRLDAPLALAAPQLYVQGSRDPFGTPEELTPHLARMQRAALHPVPEGDHSLERPKRSGVPLEDTMADAAARLRQWLEETVTDDST